jgi:hypothetical protein
MEKRAPQPFGLMVLIEHPGAFTNLELEGHFREPLLKYPMASVERNVNA